MAGLEKLRHSAWHSVKIASQCFDGRLQYLIVVIWQCNNKIYDLMLYNIKMRGVVLFGNGINKI